MNRQAAVLLSALALVPPAIAYAAPPVVVNQIRRAFSMRDLHVHRGDVVRFNNADEFLHQIYVDSPTFKYSSKEQSPGETVDISFPSNGTFDVRCEIHPKMLLHVFVE